MYLPQSVPPLVFFFFLMIRQPPRSTLFPYTTLSDLQRCGPVSHRPGRSGSSGLALPERRSEEHTSELQSRQYLVCRLLLEKKNNATTNGVTVLKRKQPNNAI